MQPIPEYLYYIEPDGSEIIYSLIKVYAAHFGNVMLTNATIQMLNGKVGVKHWHCNGDDF